MSTISDLEYQQVGNYSDFEIYLGYVEGTEGKFGFSSVPASYRGKIIHQEHGAEYNFPTKTDDKQEAIERVKMMCDIADQTDPDFRKENIVIDRKGRKGAVKEISYYNMPFCQELPNSNTEPKISYTVEVDEIVRDRKPDEIIQPSTGRKTVLEYQIKQKVREGAA